MIQHATPELETVTEDAYQRPCILVVDDDEDQAYCLTRRLNGLGFETCVAHTGRHGIGAAHRELPNLILLDLRLPDIDGLEVCSQLADSDETCEIPIIILSGMERPDVIRNSRAAGCTYYVRKPYDPNALLTLIQHAIENDRRDAW